MIRLKGPLKGIKVAPVDQGAGAKAQKRVAKPNVDEINELRRKTPVDGNKLPIGELIPEREAALSGLTIKTIWVVDDELMGRDGMVRNIKRAIKRARLDENVEVRALSHEEIRTALENETLPDVIFTDFNMPGITGGQVTSLARTKNMTGFIFGMSGKSNEQAFYEAGADLALPRPVLGETIEKLLGLEPAPRPPRRSRRRA